MWLIPFGSKLGLSIPQNANFRSFRINLTHNTTNNGITFFVSSSFLPSFLPPSLPPPPYLAPSPPAPLLLILVVFPFRLDEQHVTPEARDLIGKLIRKKPADRLPLERVPQHPWIVKFTSS